MPKAIHYKANSVIYFAGDIDDRVFLLNTGRVVLTSVDVVSGLKATEYVKQGAFFGVKSALGNYPREERAVVLADSFIYMFKVKEFEEFVQSNARVILQMLKVFSRQLRLIHKQSASFLNDGTETADPEEGLVTVMNAFYKSRRYGAVGAVGERYKKLYPEGKYMAQVDLLIRSTKEAGEVFQVQEENFVSYNHTPEASDLPGDVHLSFNLAEALFAEKNYEEAYRQYHIVIEADTPDEVTESAYMGAGKCLFFQAEYVRCLQLLTGFISKNPRSLKIAEALVCMGQCYQNMTRPEKAAAFYEKALLLADPLLVPKIKSLQEECSSMIGDN